MNTNNIQKVNYQKILDKITDKIEKEFAEGETRPARFLEAGGAAGTYNVL